jgi:hypothetical protein
MTSCLFYVVKIARSLRDFLTLKAHRLFVPSHGTGGVARTVCLRPLTFSVAPQTRSFINLDGNPDIVLVNQHYAISILFGNGGGAFNPVVFQGGNYLNLVGRVAQVILRTR